MEDEAPLVIERTNIRRSRVTVEPIGFFFALACTVQAIVIQNLYLNKVCLVNFHLNATDCTSHNQTREANHEVDVQKYVSNLNIYATIIENVPSTILVLFLGPWSEKNGRKLPMVTPLIGLVLSIILYIANYYFESWPAEYILLSSVPFGLFGGSATLLMALNSYIADITTSETRTARFSFMYGCMAVGYPLGNFISIYIYIYGGSIAIWGTSMGIGLITILYIMFAITDSRGREELQNCQSASTNCDAESEECADSNSSSGLEIFANIWESFAVTFQPRNGYKRACLTLLLASMTIYVFLLVPGSITYLYTRELFNWDQPQFALFSTIGSLSAVLGTLVVLPMLSSFLKMRDSIIGIISILANIAGSLTLAFATTPMMIYLATIGYVLTSGTAVVIRSLLSKLVLNDELSHVFSVLASFESIVPLASSSVYNLVYEATIEVFTGCVYLLASSLLVVVLILLSTVLILQWKEKNTPVLYNPMDPTPLEEALA